jgi:hypothetical protein
MSEPGGSQENPRMDLASGIGAELVEELRTTLERAAALLHVLESNLQHVPPQRAGVTGEQRTTELEKRLERTESDVAELASQLAVSERQTSRLMNLYVATYQLHATLIGEEVEDTIAEIAVNLLGAEKFVLLLKADEGAGHRVALARGIKPGEHPLYDGGAYAQGDPMVDAVLGDGVLRLGPFAGSPALAAVPLKVQGEIVGAIVFLKLFDHKPSLRTEDRELLDLLSAHAASALFAAQAFANKERRLRTLESLVKLARGE